MIKRFCDLCKKEIEVVGKNLEVTTKIEYGEGNRYNYSTKILEVCGECIHTFELEMRKKSMDLFKEMDKEFK